MELANYRLALKAVKPYLKFMGGNLGERTKWKCNTSFYIVYPDKAVPCAHTACFSGLGGTYVKRTGAVALIVGIHNGYESSNLPDEVRIKYLDWLLNRSPWRKGFVTKVAKTAHRRRYVIQDTTVPGNLMVGGGVGLRRMWETIHIVQRWYDLSVAGVNETLSYYLACSSTGAPGGNIYFGTRLDGGHENLFVDTLSDKGLLNFMTDKFKPNGSYQKTNEYRGYSDMWNEVGTKQIGRWINQNFPYKEVEKVNVANLNPFSAAKPVIATPGRKYEKGIERMVEFQHKIFKEIGYE